MLLVFLILLACADTHTCPQKSEEKQVSEYEKKKQTFITRTIWTFVMIAGFFISMFSGHIYIIIVVTAVQIVSFKEVIAIANIPSKEKNLRFTKSLNWYFLATTMYFLYGESVIYYFKHVLLVDKVLLPFATHHRFISFMLYIMGEYIPPQKRVADTAFPDIIADLLQDLCSSWGRYKKGTISSSSRSLRGPTWLFT